MDVLNYTLRAELHTRKDEGVAQFFLFEREYTIKYLGKRGEYAAYYDPELKMHFENKSALSFVYEIEVNNNNFLLSSKMEKATDFVRRVNYMFNWMQLQVSLQGEIRSIENKNELKKEWNGIKKILLSDYNGQTVGTYLAEADLRLEDEDALHSSIKQYFNFGLLFPPIPVHHGNDWQDRGLIEFSEYEGEKFESLITFNREEENRRIYSLDIMAIEESDIQLEQYEGSVIMCKNEHLPLSAIVEVVFRRGDVANQWYFKLARN